MTNRALREVSRSIVIATVVGALVLIGVSPVAAQTPIGSCPFTCSSNCFLQNDISCTNGQGVTLNSGRIST